ncbi:hypothetical protein NDU88_005601 [Pleurodeles waltl]|uniref:Uncharacterized protein n=1 Tax=Pleurodeles waltl TaxID=8319 RepID=A0AAV7TC25_PLEWA|nr:hypothetical protein NDU88_005601 [Pleurodeles waltl]
MNEVLQQEIGAVSVRLGLLRAEYNKLVDRVKGVESGLEELRLSQPDLARQVDTLSDKVHTLEHRAEGRNRRDNIRIVGLPEGTGGNDKVTYNER